MAAYLIAEHKVTDAAKFEEYRSKVGPMIARHGGKYLTRGGSHKILEKGYWQPERVVVIEFPDMAALNAWPIQRRTAAHQTAPASRDRHAHHARRSISR